MDSFPTIEDLARAREEKVLRFWQGLGYYSRARNLHATAKFVSNELRGKFPQTYSEILKLKGIGPYTAAAIASICFDEPKPVVDGNVFRFASRYFGIEEDISKSKTRKIFENILGDKILHQDPGNFNQAMMEFGATVCAPKPDCDSCVFHNDCYARSKGLQGILPTKSGKTKVRDRHLHYVVFKWDGRFLLKQRNEKDVWSSLFDFHLIEGKHSVADLLNKVSMSFSLKTPILEEVVGPIKHLLSHQRIHAMFYEVSLSENEASNVLENSPLKPYSVEEMLNLPKPKLIVNYLQRAGIK